MPVYDPLLQGFSNLSSALLVAPQMARQRRMEEEDRAYRRQAQESALAQALTINNRNIEQRQTERADRLAELQQRKADSDLDRALRADENKSQQEYRSQQIKRSAEDSRRATAEEARRWVEMGGKALGSVLGRKPGAAAQRPILNNLGSELQPDQRQWNPVTETWDKPRLGGELSAALGAPAPVNGAPAPTMTRPNGEVWTYNEGTGGYVPPGGMTETPGGISAASLRTSGAPGINTLGDFLGGRWFGKGETGGLPTQAPDVQSKKLADLPRFRESAAQHAATLPPGQQEGYLGVRNALLDRWAQAVQAGDTELEARIARVLAEQGAAYEPAR